MLGLETVVTLVPMAESHEVAVRQLTALGQTCRTGSVEQNEQILRSHGRTGKLSLRKRCEVLRQQHVALVFVNNRTEFLFGDEQFGVGVLHHEVESLGRVGRVERLISTAGFEYAKRGDGHPLAARDEDRDDVFMLEALAHDVGRDAVGQFVHFAVGVAAVRINHCDVVGRLCGLTTEERDDGLGGVVGHFGLIETVEQTNLCFADEADGGQRCCRSRGEGIQSVADGFCQRLHGTLAVPAVVVLDGDTGLAVHLHHVEGDLELGHIQLHVVGLYGLTMHFVVAEDTHLVGEHDLCRQVVVGGNTRERVVFVCQCLLERVGCFAEKLFHGLLAHFGRQSQGVDEHTHRVRDAEVAAAVRDGGDTNLVGVGKPCQGVEHRGQRERCGSDALRFGQLLGCG